MTIARAASSIAGLCLLATPGSAAEACRITDPTGTPLNVRGSPNGRIVDTIENGRLVTILDRTTSNGKPWVYVGDASRQARPIGWVFREFVSCYRVP